MNAALLLREIPMILYVSVLRQGIPSDDSLRFLLDFVCFDAVSDIRKDSIHAL